MAADLVMTMGKRCLLVLDAYFAVGPVFAILKKVVDLSGQRLVHIVTRAKSNVVAYGDPPDKTGKPGRPRQYGPKLKLIALFEARAEAFEQTAIELYGCCKTVSFLCLDLIWKPVGEKVRFVLVTDGAERFILMCSDLTLSAPDIIRAYSYRFKIEVSFKVLKPPDGCILLPFLDKRLAAHWQTNGHRPFRNQRFAPETVDPTDHQCNRSVRQLWLYCHRYSPNHRAELSPDDLGKVRGLAADRDLDDPF